MVGEIVKQLWQARRHAAALSGSGRPARSATLEIASGAIAAANHSACHCGAWIHAHASGINQTMKKAMNIVVVRP